ncbi:MAG: glycosyltransferase family 39 protein [Planctomycetes bacterium]|nr:glycosyltransferase family 39 protein [Planctomycetota bacterium]
MQISDEKRQYLLRGCLVALAPALLVAMTLRDPGLTYDEAIYLGMAVRYTWLFAPPPSGDWHDVDLDRPAPGFKARYANSPRPWTTFSRPMVDFFWWIGQKHPPLAKLAMAASLLCLNRSANLLSALRVPSVVAFAILLFLVYAFGERQITKHAGLFAALSLALMPRVFGHAHLAALDIPVTLMWFATAAAFVKGIESKPWAAAAGAIFGLALLTKINAVLIPFALLPWGLLYHRKKCIPNIIAMLVIAPVIFLIGWPALWHAPIGRTWGFLSTAFARTHIPVYYFGTQYTETNPPVHYPLLLVLFTLPLATTLFAAVAIGRNIRSVRSQSALGLILCNIFVILGTASLPAAPKYDGVRLFLPVFPFIALLAGSGLAWAWKGLAGRGMRLAMGLAIVYFGVQTLSLYWVHPYQLSYYSIACGGVPGAAKLGMETTYWGEALNDRVFNYVEKNLPPASFMEFRHIGADVIAAHRNRHVLGDLPGNIGTPRDTAEHRYLFLLSRQGMFDNTEWEYFNRHTPLWQVSLQGVPLCGIYEIEAHE